MTTPADTPLTTYQRRIQRGLDQGLTRQEARGHKPPPGKTEHQVRKARKQQLDRKIIFLVHGEGRLSSLVARDLTLRERRIIAVYWNEVDNQLKKGHFDGAWSDKYRKLTVGGRHLEYDPEVLRELDIKGVLAFDDMYQTNGAD